MERKLINGNRIELGVCYYPEHWARSLWKDDLRRMKAAGLGTIRVAEFAWNLTEPTEGVFTYDFWDEFLDLAYAEKIKVIFCTPTATPPAWLTEKYPEVLNSDIDGHKIYHGSRRHYNYNSPVYREKCRIIVEKTAAHYGKHPAIVGWQLDNEFNCENDRFYSEADTVAFRVFLKDKYRTLDRLNKAWGTVFWNQTYTDWQQVHLPRRSNTFSPNPHQELDFLRFISTSCNDFAAEQAEILRKYLKEGDFITTNGCFGHLNYQEMRDRSLDVLMYDSYPDFGYALDGYNEKDSLKDRWWSKNLSEVRAVSDNFGIMEQQGGANGWNTRMEAPSPRPGQLTLWAAQSIAHGADFVSFFRWRTCTFGTEIYWHGILDYSGRDNRRLKEVSEFGNLVKKMDSLAGSKYKAEIAVLKDYDNIWDSEVDHWHGRVERKSQDSLFEAMQLSHTPFNYVYFEGIKSAEDLAAYKVIFYPHASILTKERVDILSEYVKNGGKLVMGARTGYKTVDGHCTMEKLPGLAAELTGTDIPEYSFVAPDDGKINVRWENEVFEAAVFNDLLAPIGTGEVLGTYDDSYYKGTPALIRNKYGDGEAYYFGGAFGVDTVMVFLKKLGVIAPFADLADVPREVEVAVREKNDRRYLFLLNYSRNAVLTNMKTVGRDMATGSEISGEINLEPYGVRIICL